ncbi:MAG TPA: hypothetical protein VHB79_25970 [Polyangiaceae bacterium]|nr:hypothetical protein [Polyangiaceae bacterium]
MESSPHARLRPRGEAFPAAAVLAGEVERRLGRPVFDTKAERSIEVDVMVPARASSTTT